MSAKTSSRSLFVEPLESRIAPAVIFVGGGSSPNDISYAEDPFETVASNAYGAAFVGGSEGFVLKLKGGDTVKIWTGTSYQDYITVQSGNVVAFFTDDNDDAVEIGELTGLSLGKGVSMKVFGNVNGDVVNNFNDITGLISQTGAEINSKLQSINAFEADNVLGSIVSLGNISNINVKSVETIEAGTAGDAFAYDFNGAVGGGGAVLDINYAAKQIGASIKNVTVTNAISIEAGAGGEGALGGSIITAKILGDVDGINIFAGAGGDGGGSAPNGGRGGSLSNIIVGLASGITDVSTGNLIDLRAGIGGDATTNGVGGIGGDATKIYVGYSPVGSGAVESGAPLLDRVSVSAGDGGSGKTGGAGGKLTTVNVITGVTGAGGNEIEIAAGDGGAANNVVGARSGAGGVITAAYLESLDITNPSAVDVVVQGGNGGIVGTHGIGGNGGTITNLTAIGGEIDVLAGNGANGVTKGGIGGNVNNVNIRFGEGGVNNFDLTVNAGKGGNASGGVGGSGGNINGVKSFANDYSSIVFNQADAGNGGTSSVGTGAKGGTISKIQISENDAGFGLDGTLSIKAGFGGNGSVNGGLGGNLLNVEIEAADLAVSMLAAGNGGNSTAAGNGSGGKGGVITTVSGNISGNTLAAVDIDAGKGGNGVGAGAGGIGGDIKGVIFTAEGNIVVAAGDGGNTGAGIAGRGGNVLSSAEVSAQGLVSVSAGDAGTGGKAGAGGNITSNQIVAATNVSVLAGNGAAGGVGGSVKTVGFLNNESSILAPGGNVTISAGNGSGGATIAGNGGNITGVNGYIGAGNTVIEAGDGGVSADNKRAGVGGAVSTVKILGGGGGSAVFSILAGDAGDASQMVTGAKGGNVSNVIVASLADGTIFRSVAAGDGGNALTNGGLGGTVDKLYVDHEIGQFSGGATFGINSMGGIFAGAGGTGGVKAGLAGNVTNVTADSIASIVAGKGNGAALQLVTKVDKIFLNGNVGLAIAGNDAYTNYDDANKVGAVAGDPTLANGGDFKFTNNGGTSAFEHLQGDTATDGLIAAITLGTKNFVPSAWYTKVGNSYTLIDDTEI